MKFKFKPSPHVHGKQTTDNILTDVAFVLLIVAIWGIVNQYILFGVDKGVHAGLMLFAGVATTIITHFVFYLIFDKFENKKFDSFLQRFTANTRRVFSGAPIITAYILILLLPVTTPIYVVIVACIFAEVIAKLLFGGFGGNLFNPAAAGYIFVIIAFGALIGTESRYLAETMESAYLANATIENWHITQEAGRAHIDNIGFLPFLLGRVPGAIGATSLIPILLAMAFLIYRKIIDWVIPVFYIGFVFVGALLFGLYLGVGFWYPILHLLSGTLLFTAVFMATDPVTKPINRQGRIIFAIFLGMLTLLFRFNANHTEEAAYAILIMNMFVPLIDRKTANITTIQAGKKWASIAGVFVLSLGIVLVFAIFV